MLLKLADICQYAKNGQKTSKMSQKWGFSPICDPPRIFFKNRALSLLYPYGALTSCKKLEKSLERSLRYLKTDHGQTNHGQGQLLRTPSGKPGVQNWKMLSKKLCCGVLPYYPVFRCMHLYTKQPIFTMLFYYIKMPTVFSL